METYRTLGSRRLELATLTPKERKAFAELKALYRTRPSWDAFARAWIKIAREKVWGRKKIPVGSTFYQVCQDLELRLGVAEGRIAPPDYRDRLAGLIEDRFGSRYAFCKAAGIDQGNLSHVLAGTKHFSSETLFKVLDALGMQMEFVDRSAAVEHVGDPFLSSP